MSIEKIEKKYNIVLPKCKETLEIYNGNFEDYTTNKSCYFAIGMYHYNILRDFDTALYYLKRDVDNKATPENSYYYGRALILTGNEKEGKTFIQIAQVLGYHKAKNDFKIEKKADISHILKIPNNYIPDNIEELARRNPCANR